MKLLQFIITLARKYTIFNQ